MALFAQCSALKTINIYALQGTAFDLRWLVSQPWACTQLEELRIPITLERRCEREQLDNTEVGPMSNTAESSTGEEENGEHMIAAKSKKAQSELEQIEEAFMKRLGCLTHLRRIALHPKVKI
ncbi:hypothetical protein BGZ73_001095, partial [Actinomortierella ambigua]